MSYEPKEMRVTGVQKNNYLKKVLVLLLGGFREYFFLWSIQLIFNQLSSEVPLSRPAPKSQ